MGVIPITIALVNMRLDSERYLDKEEKFVHSYIWIKTSRLFTKSKFSQEAEV